MSPLQLFAQEVSTARCEFEATRGMSSWLVFFEAKQEAYAKLAAAVPEVKQIEDFWRYVQNISVKQYLPILDSEIKRIRATWKCRDCGTPMQRAGVCPECLKERRLEGARIYQEEKRQAEEQAKAIAAKKLCRDCHRIEVTGIKRYCERCSTKRNRENGRARARKYRSNVTKTVSGALLAEALI